MRNLNNQGLWKCLKTRTKSRENLLIFKLCGLKKTSAVPIEFTERKPVLKVKKVWNKNTSIILCRFFFIDNPSVIIDNNSNCSFSNFCNNFKLNFGLKTYLPLFLSYSYWIYWKATRTHGKKAWNKTHQLYFVGFFRRN